ncbi:MAG: hypothetical protein II984_05200 [Clostridia bacterium]|nr:hypothetical protein [Clostridia bacterium]
MKKALLVLFAILIMLALFGCNNNDVYTDTGSESLPNDSDAPNQETTENTFTVNKIYDRYFDKVTSNPTYLLDDMEEKRGSYKIIKTYEEYATCVDKTDGVSAELFKDNCIFIIKNYGNSFNAVKSASFLSENKIIIETRSGDLDDSYGKNEENLVLNNFFLIVPKSYISEGASLLGNMEIEINVVILNSYKLESRSLDKLNSDFENFEEKNAFIFDNADDFWYFDHQLRSDFTINNNFIALVFRYDMENLSGFKCFNNFYIEGSDVYLTLNMYEIYESESKQNNIFLVKILKENVEEAKLPENPVFHITINQYYD